MLDAVTPACSRRSSGMLHLFGTIRGEPVDANKGIYKAELIIEKPRIEVAREKLATPGLPAGNYLAHFGMHVFSPRIFDSLEYLIKNNLREKGEIQLTAAQEHLRQQTRQVLGRRHAGPALRHGHSVRADGNAARAGAQRHPPHGNLRSDRADPRDAGEGSELV